MATLNYFSLLEVSSHAFEICRIRVFYVFELLDYCFIIDVCLSHSVMLSELLRNYFEFVNSWNISNCLDIMFCRNRIQ